MAFSINVLEQRLGPKLCKKSGDIPGVNPETLEKFTQQTNKQTNERRFKTCTILPDFHKIQHGYYITGNS